MEVGNVDDMTDSTRAVACIRFFFGLVNVLESVEREFKCELSRSTAFGSIVECAGGKIPILTHGPIYISTDWMRSRWLFDG